MMFLKNCQWCVYVHNGKMLKPDCETTCITFLLSIFTFYMLWKGSRYIKHVAAAAKLLQLCPTLCDPIDGSPPGSPVPGILQARTLEWVAISFSNAWKWKNKVKSLSRVRLLVTPWTIAHQAPPSMDFPGKSTGVGCHWLLRLNMLPMILSGWWNYRWFKIFFIIHLYIQFWSL